MQNHIACGDTIDVTLGSGETTYASGKLYPVGSAIGVITSLTRAGQTVFNNAASAAGDIAVVSLEGVYSVPKATGAVTLGQRLYYDASAKNLTTTASGNTFVGLAYASALSGDTTVQVILLPGDRGTTALSQGAAVANLGTTSDMTAIAATYADLAAARTSVNTLRTDAEARLDAIEAKLDALLTSLRAAGLIAT
jgi:predicted RecA/RadA family phage recombinase